MNKIENIPLRDQVHAVLLERIISWDYPPRTNLQDTVIAEELEISRTPVREALLRLAKEGLVATRQGRGFTVRPLERREMEESYPILWTLESLALSLLESVQAEVLNKLEGLNRELANAELGSLRRVQIDAEWHRTLISGCPNGRLLALVEDLRKIVLRHELGYMRDGAKVGQSVGFHGRIVETLRAGDLTRARGLLEEHWKTSLEVWLSIE